MSTKPNKTKTPKKKWFLRENSIYNSPISRAYRKYLRNILWNSAIRIIFSAFFAGLFLTTLILFLLFLSAGKLVSNWVLTSVVLATLIVPLYFSAKYVWSNYNQLSYEIRVNQAISWLKWRIKRLRTSKEKKNYRAFQFEITILRTNLMNFLENSEIISPPIANFELNRLKERIDIFSNCASEALVPINKLFSRAEEFGAEVAQAQSESGEFNPDDELLEMEEEQNREMTGEFTDFDLKAMDDFLDHLWDVLFEKEVKPYSPSPYKHPINLILLSRFFDRWNSKIATCPNCKEIYKRAKKDIEDYYKSVSEMEQESRQRRWRLRDDVIVVIVSVGLSTLIQYLISLPK
jgi:hypothetical protein